MDTDKGDTGATAPEWVCPIYNCTLSRELHDPVEPEGAFGCEPDSLWHGNELDGAFWPAPFEPSAQATPVEGDGFYSAAERRFQELERERRLQWVRTSWLSSVQDIDFDAHMLNSPVVFSGDLRPQTPSKEG